MTMMVMNMRARRGVCVWQFAVDKRFDVTRVFPFVSSFKGNKDRLSELTQLASNLHRIVCRFNENLKNLVDLNEQR